VPASADDRHGRFQMGRYENFWPPTDAWYISLGSTDAGNGGADSAGDGPIDGLRTVG
jgi:hypothetical protein